MLNIDKTSLVRRTFVDTYTKEVAKRTGRGGWHIPTKWNNTVDKMVTYLFSRGITEDFDVQGFVRAQFKATKEKRCKQVFKMKYPPVGALMNNMAFDIYQRYCYGITETKRASDIDLLDRVDKELAAIRKWGLNSIVSHIVNGTVTPPTVGYILSNDLLKGGERDRLLSIVKDVCTEDFLNKVTTYERRFNMDQEKGD